ncbi:alpha-amylase family glycosyl hydrolase [Anaerosporobacter faecicola]|uniref:alpha-amylase family glycosyl hydrolase n=1 Tax=Anaerosporobacter faecicola TaxID=2718714 RepID=UPI0014396A8C|nr:alpha-amylase family glycosyl hydrolase [Anaerosporobacter faecicola]
MNQLRVSKGTPLPLGATKVGEKINFSIASPCCEECKLVLLHKKSHKKKQEIIIPEDYRVGEIYSVTLEGLPYEEYDYVYEIDGKIVVDPYSTIIRGKEKWGNHSHLLSPYGIRSGLSFEEFPWMEEQTLEIPYEKLILYKLHVRGFTKHRSSGVGKAAGTYQGVIQKIPYLKELGVNSVLLMPIIEFEEILVEENYVRSPGNVLGRQDAEYAFVNIAKEDLYRKEMLSETYPMDNMQETEKIRIPYRLNYWGYSKNNYYFAPKASYASNPSCAAKELKEMVQAFHKEGMEVLMEFNFTEDVTQQMILDCLHYWYFTYHIDGFSVNKNVVLTRLIIEDPILSRTKFLATAWEEQYLAGNPKRYRNLAEYNDGFLVDARRFLKSDEEQVNAFAYRVRRNSEKYGVINYITNNNGFTLLDLVSYDVKHNQCNGEENKDGTDYNYSWNCGTEGKTSKKKIKELRSKQIRNALVMLLLSQGTPMLLMGDEMGNSQNGNNNAYCQDNATSWLNWNLRKQNEEIEAFIKKLIAIRRTYGVFGKAEEYRMMDYRSCGCPDLSFHGTKAWYPDFSYYSRIFGVMYNGAYVSEETDKAKNSFYIAYNMHWEKHEFALPRLPMGQVWKCYMHTSIVQKEEMLETERTVMVEPRSIVILRSEESNEQSVKSKEK